MRVMLIAEPDTYATIAHAVRDTGIEVVPTAPGNVDRCGMLLVSIAFPEAMEHYQLFGRALRSRKPIYFWNPAKPADPLGAGVLGEPQDPGEFGRLLAQLSEPMRTVKESIPLSDQELPRILTGISLLDALKDPYPASSSSAGAMAKRFVVPFRAVDFPDDVLPAGEGELRFSAGQLAHALFTTGRAPVDQVVYGPESFWEAVHRMSMIQPYLRREDAGGLLRTALMKSLDASERAAIAYALGQAATALFCREKLGVRHLLHVDRYAGQHRVEFDPSTKRRADLFGLFRDGWLVAEAKGRGSAVGERVRTAVRCQKNTIKTIGDITPTLTLGCLAHFPTEDGGMAIEAVDPDNDEPDNDEPAITRDGFMLAYYAPFVRAIDLGDPVPGSRAVMAAHFGGLDLTVRLSTPIYLHVQQALGGDPTGLEPAVQTYLRQWREKGLFPDGTAIE